MHGTMTLKKRVNFVGVVKAITRLLSNMSKKSCEESHGSRESGRNMKLAPPEHNSEALPLVSGC